MAELATIARPYAEALLKAGGSSAQALELCQLAKLATNPDMVQFASDPKARQEQVSQILQAVYQEQFGLLIWHGDQFAHSGIGECTPVRHASHF